MRVWTLIQIKRVRQLADHGYSIERLIIETGFKRRTILSYLRLSEEGPTLGTRLGKRRKVKSETPTPIVPLTPLDLPVSSLSPSNVDDGDTHSDYSNKALENARSKVNGTARRRKTRK